MTKYERDVLKACEARFARLLKDDGYQTPQQVLEAHRGLVGKGERLIRACARWLAQRP